MPSFRILSQSPVYFLLDGKTPAADGRIEFYEAGTTTPKDVYGDVDLTVNNGSSIVLGSDGRASDDIWGDGSYRVRVYAADDTLISDDDNVEIPGGDGTAIPALEAGKVLSNDGAVLQWLELQDVPDPTGQSGKILSSDGSAYTWTDAPTSPDIPTGGISTATKKITIDNILIQWGSGEASASGFRQTSVGITFGTAFSSCQFVGVTPTSNTTTSGGQIGVPAVTSKSTTGFAVAFDTDDFGETNAQFINPVPFDWIAIGTVAT